LEAHPETGLFVEQLVLACASVGGLHVLGGDMPAATRFLGLAEEALNTSMLQDEVYGELRMLVSGLQSQVATREGDRDRAMKLAEIVIEEAHTLEDLRAEVEAEMLIAYTHSAFGEHEAAREILGSTLEAIRSFEEDMVLVESQTLSNAPTKGLLQLQCPKACLEALCMYGYVTAMIGCKDEGAVKEACSALELMLGCFEAPSSTGALSMFEHLFKVAAGVQEGTVEAEISIPDVADAQVKCVHYLQSIHSTHSLLSAPEREALAPPRDGRPGNATPSKRHGKRRILGIPRRPQATRDETGWVDGPMARGVQAVFWSSLV